MWRDSFTNLLTGLGLWGRDPVATQRYALDSLSMDQAQLEAAYRGNWIARKCVNIPADDATRAWREWQAEKQQITAIEKAEKDLRLQQQLRSALIKSRLYGGALMILGVDGAGSFSEPLDVERVKKGALKFVHVVPKHQIEAGMLVRNVDSPWFGTPQYYRRSNQVDTELTEVKLPEPLVGMTEGGMSQVTIHPSRAIRFVGCPYPDPESAPDQWGDSVLQAVDEAIKSAGLVTRSIAQLTNKAAVDVIHVPSLTNSLTTSEGTSLVIDRFAKAQTGKSIANALLLDTNEEWEQMTVTFASLPQVMQMFLLLAAGAVDIPATRFLSQDPAGMNATGASDTRNYYDRVKSDQVTDIQPALNTLDEVLIRHALGSRDEEIFYDWRSLWQQSDDEKATTAFKKAQAFKIDVDSGLVPPDALRKGRENQLIEDGTYPGLELALEEAEQQDKDDIDEANLLSITGGENNLWGGGPLTPEAEVAQMKLQQAHAEKSQQQKFQQQKQLKQLPPPRRPGNGRDHARDWDPNQERDDAGRWTRGDRVEVKAGEHKGAVGTVRSTVSGSEGVKHFVRFDERSSGAIGAAFKPHELGEAKRVKPKSNEQAMMRKALGRRDAWDPNQPREPAGSPTGGQWTSGGGGGGSREAAALASKPGMSDMPAVEQINAVVKMYASEGGWDLATANPKFLGEQKMKAAHSLGLGFPAASWAMTAEEEKAAGAAYGSIEQAWSELKPGKPSKEAPMEGAFPELPNYDYFKGSKSLDEHIARYNATLSKPLRTGQYRWRTSKLIEEAKILGEKGLLGASANMITKMKQKIGESFALQAAYLEKKGVADKFEIGKLLTKAEQMGFDTEPFKQKMFAGAMPQAPKAVHAPSAEALKSGQEKLKMAVTMGQGVPELLEALSVAENQALKSYYGTTIKAALEQEIALANAAKASTAATVAAAQPVGKATPEELAKAKKASPYYPAPESYEGQQIVKPFNEKWAGKEITDPALLEQKVVEYKQIKLQLAAIAAKEQEAKEQAVKAAQIAQAKAEAAAAAKAKEQEAQHAADLAKIVSGLGIDPKDAQAVEGFMELSGSTSIADTIAKFKQYEKEGQHLGLPISPFEYAMLRAYTGSAHSAVNQALWKGAWSTKQYVFINACNGALKKMPKWKNETVWRGTNINDIEVQQQYKKGEVIQWRGFASCAKTQAKAWAGNMQFTIHHKGGRDVQMLSNHPGEQEVLMPAMSFVRVNSVTGKPGGTMHVDLTEVEML